MLEQITSGKQKTMLMPLVTALRMLVHISETHCLGRLGLTSRSHIAFLLVLSTVEMQAGKKLSDVHVLPAPKEKITLDGRLDDAAWKNAVLIDQFHQKKKTVVAAKTIVRVLADNQFLYVGWYCQDESTETLKGDVTSPNGPCWDDDAVELFVDPGHSFASMIQIITTCKGIVFQKGYGRFYEKSVQDFGVASSSFIGANFWSVETRIPINKIGLSASAFHQIPKTFLMNFGRDLRNSYYQKQHGERMDFSVSPMGYFDRQGFLPFLFGSSAHSLVILDESKNHVVNELTARLTISNNSNKDQVLSYYWSKASQVVTSPRKPLLMKSGEVKTLSLPVADLTSGDIPYRIEVFDQDESIFIEDFLFSLDAPIDIAPNFPCRTADAGEKVFRLIPASYLLATDKPYSVTAVVEDISSLPILTRRFPQLTYDLSFSVTKIFADFEAGRYKLKVTLYEGDKQVAVKEYAFFKVPSEVAFVAQPNIIKNWGFEETSDARPKSWRDLDPKVPDAEFPSGWRLWKLADWIGWGDLGKIPRSIYEGRRSLILQGLPRSSRQQLHWGSEKFKVNLKSSYLLSIAARGKGTIRCCYYLATAEGKWIKRFFYTRDIVLTDEWVEYQFDPVNFNANTEKSWDDSQLGLNNLPDTASVVIWVQDDGLAFIDNVVLHQTPD